jgi:hypothetical protein
VHSIASSARKAQGKAHGACELRAAAGESDVDVAVVYGRVVVRQWIADDLLGIQKLLAV